MKKTILLERFKSRNEIIFINQKAERTLDNLLYFLFFIFIKK